MEVVVDVVDVLGFFSRAFTMFLSSTAVVFFGLLVVVSRPVASSFLLLLILFILPASALCFAYLRLNVLK